MARNNFPKAVKRAALKRSGMLCEAVGAWYGLEPGKRCNAPLARGVEYDHVILDANSKDASIENCAAVCIPCHKFKTAKIDIPRAAKTVRQQDRDRGITKPAGNLKGPGFPPRAPKDRTSTKQMPPSPPEMGRRYVGSILKTGQLAKAGQGNGE